MHFLKAIWSWTSDPEVQGIAFLIMFLATVGAIILAALGPADGDAFGYLL